MVVLPAGNFMMGSPASERDRDADEGPQRRVSLPAFALGKTEVTQAQWQALMGTNPSSFKQCGGDCPVENVSWEDAQAYIRKLNEKTGKTYTLPSESQWEYAARAGMTTPFHTGATITTDQANFDGSVLPYNGGPIGSYRKAPVKVGSFGANAFGLHDMHGNVWEWAQDCHDEKAYAGKAPSDGKPLEGASCASRVLRGGSWFNFARLLRSAFRFAGAPGYRSGGIGFRVCRVSPIE